MDNSFLEKLKRGMGIEPEKSDFEIEKVEEGPAKTRKKSLPKAKRENEDSREDSVKDKEKWLEPKGELAIDLYETETEFILEAPIAGVKREDLEILVENDVMRIKGKRDKPQAQVPSKYLVQECFWGEFSREIIFPQEVDGSRTEALLENGVLVLRIPKIERQKKVKVEIK